MNRSLICLIDTYSWSKLIHLKENGWTSILDIIIENNSIFLTHEVKKEIEYRQPESLHYLQKMTLLPLIEIDFHKFERLGFDKADASLITYSEQNNIPVVTEDHPMLALGIVDQLDFIQLVDLFFIMNQLDQITKNEFHKLVRKLRSMRNITIHKQKKLLKGLNQ